MVPECRTCSPGVSLTEDTYTSTQSSTSIDSNGETDPIPRDRHVLHAVRRTIRPHSPLPEYGALPSSPCSRDFIDFFPISSWRPGWASQHCHGKQARAIRAPTERRRQVRAGSGAGVLASGGGGEGFAQP